MPCSATSLFESQYFGPHHFLGLARQRSFRAASSQASQASPLWRVPTGVFQETIQQLEGYCSVRSISGTSRQVTEVGTVGFIYPSCRECMAWSRDPMFNTVLISIPVWPQWRQSRVSRLTPCYRGRSCKLMDILTYLLPSFRLLPSQTSRLPTCFWSHLRWPPSPSAPQYS